VLGYCKENSPQAWPTSRLCRCSRARRAQPGSAQYRFDRHSVAGWFSGVGDRLVPPPPSGTGQSVSDSRAPWRRKAGPPRAKENPGGTIR